MTGLKYISWGDTTGYAVAAKAYVRALARAGVNLTWTPMMPGVDLYEAQSVQSWPCAELDRVCNRQIDYDRVVIHTVPEYFPEWIDKERRPGVKIFGYTVWELETLPTHWPAILNRLDGVIVPCEWNREVFQRSGVTVPIHVVPHLSQFDGLALPQPQDRTALAAWLGRYAQESERFVFYTIGFWSNRKAPYLALQAYWQAFTGDDPVLMVVKTCEKDITRWHRHWRNGFRRRHPSPVRTIAAMAKGFANPAPVVVIADESLSDGEILALHDAGDCFVSLTRTEGWGLGAFEAARLGKPVIMTGYGGQLDFLAPEQADLIDFELVPVHEPTWAASYKPHDKWAEPSVEQAAKRMRAVLADRTTAASRGQQLAERISCDFSTAATVERFKAVLA